MIRKQKSTHWNDFLADDVNIWQASKSIPANQQRYNGRQDTPARPTRWLYYRG